MPYKMVTVEKGDGIATITLNRPEKRNAFNMEMMGEMDAAFDEAARDRDVMVIILTGAGTAFSSGLDFNWAADMDLENQPPMASTVRGRQVAYEEKSLLTLVLKMQSSPKPVIAAINGITLGGGLVLALACDLRIASETAEFGMIQVNRGIIPDGGGTYILPRIVGMPKALELGLTADRIDAPEAEKIGLVNKVVGHDNVMSAATHMAERIARNAPLAVMMTKAAMYRGIQEPDLAAHMDHEVYIMNILFGTQDFQEGIAAVFQKREPEFKGK
jgi:enoyl-CoA hydratase/carnithine racemase